MIDGSQAAYWCIDGAWMAWLMIWVALALRVKPAVARQSVSGRAAHILPLIIAACVLLFCPHGQGWWTCRDVFPRARWAAPAGTFAVLAGLSFAVWARAVLAGNWSGIVTIKQDHELIRTGPYNFVRHPIYTGLLTAMAGTAVAVDQWRGIVALTIVTASFLVKIRTEEAFMRRAFGQTYTRYTDEVAGLIPWLW